MLIPLFHRCKDAEQHIGEQVLFELIGEQPNDNNFRKFSKALRDSEPTSYWLKYNMEKLGIIKLKIVSQTPLMLFATFTPLANLN